MVISNYLALGKLRVLKEGMWSSESAAITWEVLGVKKDKQKKSLASAKKDISGSTDRSSCFCRTSA